jgi:hypothetical protein
VALRGLLRPAAWRGGLWRSLIATLVRLAPAALMGPRPALARANVSFAIARLRCRMWRLNERRMLRAYRDAWSWMGRRARLRYLAELPPEAAPPATSAPFALVDLPDDRLFGFHPQESVNGTSFRWSRSVAFADVPVLPGAYRVEIDTGGLRDPRHAALQIFFNGHRIHAPGSRWTRAGSRSRSSPTSSRGRRSAARSRLRVVPPLAGGRQRGLLELGLPVSSIDFTRIRDASED